MKRAVDIAVNLTDDMFLGLYRGKQVHPPDLELVIERSQCWMIITGTNLEESIKAQELAQKYHFWSTVGVHPTRARDFEHNPLLLDQLKDLCSKERVIAVGECGLDYDRLQFCPKEVQLRWFERHFELTETTGLPMFLHNRNTGNDFYDIIRRNRHRFTTGVVHSFDGNLDDLQKAVELDLYIGINGCSLKTDENIATVRTIPLDRLLVETDAPWCDIRPTHASYKYVNSALLLNGKKKEKFEMGQPVKSRNEPSQVFAILSILSQLKQIPQPELESIVYENTRRVFPQIPPQE
ncbi:putative deoxyribonuclease TATDN1 [Gorgonomyces haynaldii]|nr:putative deoxyribonuclease TATDN1 [Gorgonomyces haynaldii]